MHIRLSLLTSMLVALLATGALAQNLVTGVVRDPTGAVIPESTVTLEANGSGSQSRTGTDGIFRFSVAPRFGTIRVQAPGFQELWRSWEISDSPISITLTPITFRKQVIVTATRTPLATSDTGASVDVLTQNSIQTSGAVTLDEALRQVLGFSLFRRSNSMVANPTTEGVSLRGIGSSGASRALVLLDGVPVSDPFGGWVYWDQIPSGVVASAEVVRGGISGLYGSDAMSGAINLITPKPERSFLDVDTALGNTFLRNGSLSAGVGTGKWSALGAIQALETDGYLIVPKNQRGQVDTPANLQYRTGYVQLERAITKGRIFASAGLLAESRNNGTQLQVNDTHLGRISVGGDFAAGSLGSFAVRVYGAGERFHQTFSAISLHRSSESLTRMQTVPSQQLGTTILWNRTLARHNLAAGFDYLDRRGHTSETAFASDLATSIIDAGGRLRNLGLFVEDIFPIGSRLSITASIRGDHWTNADGHTHTTPLTAAVTASSNLFPDRTEAAINPRVSAIYRAGSHISLTAAIYRSFRAPTLNELYRTFRVGNIVTIANSDLRAERLTGGEAGIRVTLHRDVVARATFFDSEISDPVANVTVSTSANLITRQRKNLGSTRARGLELEAEWQHRNLFLSGGYQLTDAVVTAFPANPALVGFWTPQVPRHQFTTQARYELSRWTFAAQARAAGAQFEDDHNELPLDPYFNLDAFISHALSHSVEIYLAGENVLNTRAMVGRTPTVTLGTPALVRLGIRIHLGHR